MQASPLAIGERTDAATFSVFRIAQVLMVTANLGRIPVFSTGDRDAPLMVNELCLAAVVAFGVVAILRRRSLKLDGVALAALAFAAIGAGSALGTMFEYQLDAFEMAVSLSYLARWMAYATLYVVLINSTGRDRAAMLWNPLEFMLVLLAAFGIVQAAFLPDFAQMVYPDSRAVIDWDVQGHRLVSTILEPNIAGTMLMMGVLVQLALVAAGARVSRLKLALLFVAMCLTLSRSAAVGFIAGVMTLLAIRGVSRKLLRLAVLGSIPLVLALPQFIRLAMAYGKFSIGADTSAGTRIVAWVRALGIFGQHPVFGIGFNTYAFVGERQGYERMGAATYGVEGGLLFIAVMTGVVGLSVYCLMLAQVGAKARAVWRAQDSDASARGLAIGTVAATVAIVVSSVFVNGILTTFVMEILWVLWAIVGILSARPGARDTRAMPRLVPLRV